MSADPNWLLSALAQSAAALVAIVGGFLISRVIATASDRDTIRRRINTLDSQIGARQHRLNEIDDYLHRLDALGIYIEHEDEIIAEGPDAIAEILPGTPDSDPIYQALINMAERAYWAREILQPHFVDGQPPPELDELKRAGQLDDDIPDWFYDDAWNYLDRRHQYHPPLQDMAARIGVPYTGPAGPTREDRRFRMEGTKEEVSHEVHALESERDYQQSELESLEVPNEVQQGIWVLSYFAGVGIILPLTVQAVGIVSLTGWFRALLVIAFTSGLALLLWFLRKVVASVSGAG